MSKVIRTLCVLSILLVCSGQNAIVIRRAATNGPCYASGTATIKFLMNGESGDTSGDYTSSATLEYSGGDNPETLDDIEGTGQTADVSTASKYDGSYGFAITKTGSGAFGNFKVDKLSSIMTSASGRVGFWYKKAATGTARRIWGTIVDGDDSSYQLYITATDPAYIQYQVCNDTIHTSDSAMISNGTWYFIELWWDCGASDEVHLEVDDWEYGSSDEAAADFTFDADDEFCFGACSSTTANQTDYYDDIFVTSDKTRDLYADVVTAGCDLLTDYQ